MSIKPACFVLFIISALFNILFFSTRLADSSTSIHFTSLPLLFISLSSPNTSYNLIMKLSAVFVTFLATLVVGSPIDSKDVVLKRQAAEACSVGYCTQNGGTTGGAAGSTITVTTVAALIEAAKRDGPLTIIVSGQLSGSDRVRPTSDKTIIGAAGSCMFFI